MLHSNHGATRLRVAARRSARALSTLTVIAAALAMGAGSAQAQSLFAEFTGSMVLKDLFVPFPWDTVPTPGAPAFAEVVADSPVPGVKLRDGWFENNASTPSVTYIPGYPILNFKWGSSQKAGTFGPNFLTTTVTVDANTTAYPNLVATPRTGFIRLRPAAGGNGFGGVMPINVKFELSGTRAAYVGYYDMVAYRDFEAGISTQTNPSATRATSIHQTQTYAGAPLTREAIGAVTVAPWITGTVSARVPGSYYGGLTLTNVGQDSRNAAGTTGTLSLVTPANTFSYGKFQGALVSRDAAGPSTYNMTLSFVPEPGELALLGAGLTGLLMLGAARRRRTTA